MDIKPVMAGGGYGSYDSTGPVAEFWIESEWKGEKVRLFFDPNTFVLRYSAALYTMLFMAAVVPGEGGYGVTVGRMTGPHHWVREYAFESSNPSQAAEFALDFVTRKREFTFSDDARLTMLPSNKKEDFPLVP